MRNAPETKTEANLLRFDLVGLILRNNKLRVGRPKTIFYYLILILIFFFFLFYFLTSDIHGKNGQKSGYLQQKVEADRHSGI